MFPPAHLTTATSGALAQNSTPKTLAIIALLSFGIDVYSLDNIDYSQTKDYESMSAVCDKIYKDTHKRQDINNYRYSQRFHNLDPELQKIILAYA